MFLCGMSLAMTKKPQKRLQDATESYARLQALLMSRGAGSRNIDGIPRLDHAHPDTIRCAEWMEKAAGLNTEPEQQYSSLSKKDRIDRWQTLKRNMTPEALSKLTENVEKCSGYKPYNSTTVNFTLPGDALDKQIDFLDEIDKSDHRSL